jgi:hypothetical protein
VKNIVKQAVKEAVASGAAAGAGASSISVVGGSLSASGMTGGLAILGAGSMLMGIGTVALIGVGVYKGAHYLMEKADEATDE